MADHFLSKIRVANSDFAEHGGRAVLDQYDRLRALLTERAGPEVADLFAEPLISRGNDTAPATVSWYAAQPGEARPLENLPPAEREQAERYLADHLRPLRGLAGEPETAGLALGALTTYGQGDVLVVAGKPVIVNWGLMPGGKGANASARPQHYAATLGRFLPLADPPPVDEIKPRAAPAVPPAPEVQVRRVITPLAWVPLLILLLLAGGVLAWLLMPGSRLFPTGAPQVVTDASLLRAAQAETEALRARQDQLQQAMAGAVCRADGQLILPDGLTPEGLTPPAPGVAPPDLAEAAPDALLPSRPERVLAGEDSLLDLVAARTVMVLAAGAGEFSTGSGLSVGSGLIVTNYHVIAQALGEGGQILVTGAALAEPQPATVVKTDGPFRDTGGDFALLQIADDSLPAYTVHLPDGPLTLSNVVAAGYPGDVLETDAAFRRLREGDLSAVPGLTVTDGIVNTEQQLAPETRVLMHSAALSTGNSGGPLVDMCGRLVGVNAFIRQGEMQNRGFALTSGDLMAFLAGTAAAPATDNTPCAPVVARPDLARN